jgi:23S rRNA (pseudouridine1915-N3)-methyltransferase
MIGAPKNVIFIVGGAFGHHQMLKTRADLILSLSEMTFSHQMVRLIFLEQLYRAYTIIKNEKYHNS